MFSEGSHEMKMCLKLAYCAFSSSPSKDATMSTFSGFSPLFLKFKPFDEFFSLEKSDCKSLKLSLHFSSVPFSKDGRIGLLISRFLFACC